jgi:hypothetical protein
VKKHINISLHNAGYSLPNKGMKKVAAKHENITP